MRAIPLPMACAGVFLILAAASGCQCSPSGRIRNANHAGVFFPADREGLSRSLDQFLSRVKPQTGELPKAIIVPHAGYIYSGNTAAQAYGIFQGRSSEIRRVILLATSHAVPLQGAVALNASYRTPLGDYRVDQEALEMLRKEGVALPEDSSSFDKEHSDEVQIPFLVKVLPDAKVVPIVAGEMTTEELTATANRISKIIDDRTVLVATSDFTHFGPNYGFHPHFKTDVASGLRELDEGAVMRILALDSSGLRRYVAETGVTICGSSPIQLLLKILEINSFGSSGRLLDYATSGQMTGDWTNSVSYAAVALGRLKPPAGRPVIERRFVDPAGERALLKIARFVLSEFTQKGTLSFSEAQLGPVGISEQLRQNLGVFVTLKKSGELRGCIGSIVGEKPLYSGVIENTIRAAAYDARFQKVRSDELGAIDVELSIMTPLEKLQSQSEIRIGRDGLLLTLGNQSGVFLPQVPLEWKWDRLTYLKELSRKAGLPENAYLDPAAQLYRFSAQVFGE